MKKVALVIDNSGSLTPEEMEKIHVTKMIPISFIVNGEEYYENVNMSYEEFYKFLADKKTDVSTSQPSIEMITEEWRNISKEYDVSGLTIAEPMPRIAIKLRNMLNQIEIIKA